MSAPALPRSGDSAERRPAQWSFKPLALCLFTFLLWSAVGASEANPTNTVRFRAVDVFIDSANQPLAAYQLEFTASDGAKIVGVEGGEHAAFKEPPFYDPKAIQHERVILGAFSTAAADTLPMGKTRVATIHLQTTGDGTPRFQARLTAAATANGRKISAQASANERQRNENKTASRQE